MAYFDAPYRPADLTVDSSHSLVANMQAWFPLTAGSGSVAQCILHPSHTGTLGSGVTWETSERGTVAVFDGTSNAKINFSSQLVSGQTLSFSVWLYVASSVSGRKTIYCDGQSFVQNDFRYDGNGKRFVFDHYQPSGEPNKTNTDYGIDDRWIHVVVTQDSSTTKIYYDGVLKHSGTAETYASAAPTAFNIGSRDGSDSFDGKMHNFQAWNRVISADEVALLHARPWTASNYDTEALWLSPPASPVLSSASESTSIMANCVGWWPLTQGSGSTATDLEGSNNGTLNGNATWSSTTLGTAASFDGVNGTEITVPGLSVTQPATISLWFKTTGDGKFIDGDDSTDRIQLYFSSTYLRGWAGSTVNIGNSNEFNDDEWHHVVGVFDGSSSVFYADGVQRATGNPGSRQLSGARIGAGWNSSVVVSGNVQNVRVFNAALTADQVRILHERPWIGAAYNETAPLYPPVPSSLTPLDSSSINTDQELWLPLTDGTGTTAVDISGGSNDGTLDAALTHINTAKGAAVSFPTNGGIDSSATISSQPITVSAWFYLTTLPTIHGTSLKTIFTGQGSSSTPTIYCYNPTGSKPIMRMYSGSAYLEGVSEISANDWTNVVGVFNGTSSELYVNGVLEASGNVGTSGFSSGFRLGEFWNSIYDFPGYMQNVRVWSRALSSTEVADIFYSPWLGSAYPSTGGGTPSYFVAAQFNRLGIGPRFRRL